jgi:small neutral amino acid transporter SnatA (MarC family)
MPDVTTLLSAFVTLLVTIGPFEAAPIFAGLARHLSPSERRRTIRRTVIISGVLLMSQAGGNPWHMGGVLLVLMVCLALTWLSLLSAETLIRLLGVTGSDVIGRISGLLLAALAMQYVFDGLNEGLLKRLG